MKEVVSILTTGSQEEMTVMKERRKGECEGDCDNMR